MEGRAPFLRSADLLRNALRGLRAASELGSAGPRGLRSRRSSAPWSGTPQEGTDQGAGRKRAERRRTDDFELALEREPRWREHDDLCGPVADGYRVRHDPGDA